MCEVGFDQEFILNTINDILLLNTVKRLKGMVEVKKMSHAEIKNHYLRKFERIVFNEELNLRSLREMLEVVWGKLSANEKESLYKKLKKKLTEAKNEGTLIDNDLFTDTMYVLTYFYNLDDSVHLVRKELIYKKRKKIKAPVTVLEFLKDKGYSEEEINRRIILVNGIMCFPSHVLKSKDELILLPPIVDWIGQRFKIN